MIDIDSDCGAETAGPNLCPSEFISSDSLYGVTLPSKPVLLAENQKCTIMIDATNAVGRVTFTGTNSLGVLYPGYVMDVPITINQGDVKFVTFYNGKSSGSLSMSVTFSGATGLAALSTGAALLLSSIAYMA